jgi:phospholipid-binding lipoprotein MlaA
MIRSRHTAVAALSLVLLTGCAKASDEAFDPLEPLNRSINGLNTAADILIIHPAATIYKEAVPAPVQSVAKNFFTNLEMPLIAMNKLLQGDLNGTGTAVGRFIVNSTFGVAGIGDLATSMGMPYEKTDVGATLASWGIGAGPYVVMPIIGPSNLRDSVGWGLGYLADPVRLTTKNNDLSPVYFAANALRSLTTRNELNAPIQDARTNSLDSYATLRSYFTQYRAAELVKQFGK